MPGASSRLGRSRRADRLVCEIAGPAEAADAFAAGVGLTAAERDPRSEIALVAERIEGPTRPIPLAEHRSPATAAPRPWVGLFATSVATLALVVIAGANATLLLLVTCAAALALARLAGFAFAAQLGSSGPRVGSRPMW